MPREFYIKFSGAAIPIQAKGAKDAIDRIRKCLDCYCYAFFDVKEIGVDVDSLGRPIQKDKV